VPKIVSVLSRLFVTSERVWVKVCGITNQTDAIFAVESGADALGFVFAKSPRQVTAQQVAEVLEVVPSQILTFGVFVDEDPDGVVSLVDTLGLHGAQLHGSESPQEVMNLSERIPYVIKAISAGDSLLERVDLYHRSWAILIDGPRPGSGQSFDWAALDRIRVPTRLILAGGLDAGNVANATSLVNPFGVDVSSGVERSPGHKDPAKVRAFIAAARRTDKPGFTAAIEHEGDE
jgi:phosphoribosylanthranilate isomerase